MKVRFRAPAKRELDEAVEWYEACMPGLGKRFALAVAHTLGRIQRFPAAAHVRAHGARRALVAGFPYGIWYVVEGEAIQVYAISHTHRLPGYWQDRL